VTRSIHREAEKDLIAAFRYYQSAAGSGIAKRFLDDIERVARLIEESPAIGALGENNRRNHPLSVFPYTIIYRQTATGVRILVVRHQHRHPDFGAHRR